eukprot:15344108-Ditylum_brightwellii.AAC.1
MMFLVPFMSIVICNRGCKPGLYPSTSSPFDVNKDKEHFVSRTAQFSNGCRTDEHHLFFPDCFADDSAINQHLALFIVLLLLGSHAKIKEVHCPSHKFQTVL